MLLTGNHGADMTADSPATRSGRHWPAWAAQQTAIYRSKPGRIRAAPAPRQLYDRRTALLKVLPLWPHELEDDSRQARARIVARLRSALRAERRRGIAGHWTYDLARHAELLRVYRLEAASMRGEEPRGARHVPATQSARA